MLQVFDGNMITKGSTDSLIEGKTESGSEIVLGNTEETVSVHDPSIISETKNGVTTYYIFGSHMAWAKSTDLVNWTTFTNNINRNYLSLFAKEFAWSANGNSVYDPAGNLWAPDVIYNEEMGKWCMYMSINGVTWNSSIALLTADTLSGDWTYQGTVIYSGYTSGSYAYDFTQTDFTDVTGESTLPSRYIRSEYTEKVQTNPSTIYSSASTWNKTYGAHAIDPSVTYDAQGKLWMSYGSWSGGIYMIELDTQTGFRDYNHTYTTVSNQSDAYMGIMLACGDGGTGEASYIQYINGYYYMFVTYGGLVANGGYNMRLFRSSTIDGTYVDINGDNAIGHQAVQNAIGLRLMSYYKWSWWDTAQVAQGHNSAMVDEDGNIYLVYHTRTNNGTEGHYVRVHQMFLNEDGWLCVSPFAYDGNETLTAVTNNEVIGTYEVLAHENTDYATLKTVPNKTVTLNADGTVSGSYTGTWAIGSSGLPNVIMVLGGVTYKGVFVESTMEETNVKTMTFSIVGASGSNDMAIWGSKYPSDEKVVAWTAKNLTIPTTVYGDISLEADGIYGAAISWSSSNTNVISNDGKIGNTIGTATLTATIIKGDYYKKVSKVVTVKPKDSSGKTLVGSYYTNNPLSLSSAVEGTYRVTNPFNKSEIAGLDISNGVSIKFDVKRTGGYGYLSNILSFTDSALGRLYFTGGSYLGYNATGGYFDANVDNTSWKTGTDFIGSNVTATVEIKITSLGYSVYVNNKEVYNQTSLVNGDIKGGGTLTNYYNVLTWLNQTATTLNFGWGSWWPGGFAGTISNVECYVLPEVTVDTSDYLYYHDYTKVPSMLDVWTSTDAQDRLTLVNDGDSFGNYIQFAPETANSRGAVTSFGVTTESEYRVALDVSLKAGSEQTTEFAITGTKMAYTGNNINNGISSGYILKLSATNSTTWTINGSETAVIPAKWVHILAKVNRDQGTAEITITDCLDNTVYYSNTVNIDSTEEIKGLYIRGGRYNSVTKVDNVQVYNKADLETVILNNTTQNLKIGQSATLTAKIKPVTAEVGATTWTTSNPSVATVNKGVVTAVGVGSATITATIDGKTATCVVTVEPTKVTNISISAKSKTLVVGNTFTLKATVSPANATNKGVTWKSSNTSVATVDANGKITAKKAGEATIKVEAKDGSKKANECVITVYAKATKVTVKAAGYTLKNNTIYLVKGKSVKLVSTVTPAKAQQSVTYKSGNPSVAKAYSSGKITAKKVGTARVTITSKDGKAKKVITIKVVKKAKSNTSLKVAKNKITLAKKGKTAAISATVSKTTTQKVTYRSKNKKIAKVNSYGVITAVKKGNTTITVKCGKISKKIAVTVKR